MEFNTKNLKNYVDYAVQNADYDYESTLHQVNCRITLEQLFMLEKLAQRLGESRSSVAGNLLGAAIFDAWFLAEMPSIADEEPAPEMEGKFSEEGFRETRENNPKLPAFYGVGKTKLEYDEFCAKHGARTA